MEELILNLNKDIINEYCLRMGEDVNSNDFIKTLECYIFSLTEGRYKNIKEAINDMGMEKVVDLLNTRFKYELETIGAN